jgi:hypothetical protein
MFLWMFLVSLVLLGQAGARRFLDFKIVLWCLVGIKFWVAIHRELPATPVREQGSQVAPVGARYVTVSSGAAVSESARQNSGLTCNSFLVLVWSFVARYFCRHGEPLAEVAAVWTSASQRAGAPFSYEAAQPSVSGVHRISTHQGPSAASRRWTPESTEQRFGRSGHGRSGRRRWAEGAGWSGLVHRDRSRFAPAGRLEGQHGRGVSWQIDRKLGSRQNGRPGLGAPRTGEVLPLVQKLAETFHRHAAIVT